MIPFSPFNLRLPPNGPTVEGTSDGQLLVWNQSSQGWTVADAPESRTEFDFILESRADLVAVVAPVAGVFTLPGGSYFVKSSISLLDGERVVLPAGSRMSGGGPGQVLQGSGADPLLGLLTLEGDAGADNFGISAVGGISGVFSAAEGTLLQMDIQSEGAALLVAAGSASSARSRLRSSGADTVNVLGGRWYTVADHVICGQEAAGCLVVAGADAHVFGVGTDFEVEEGLPGYVVAVDAATVLSLAGGTVRGHNTGPVICDGVLFRGDIQRTQLTGVVFEELLACVQYSAGIMFSVAIESCTSVACVNGVSWPQVSVPSQNLAEIGNTFNMVEANCFTGHVATDPNVMQRANSCSVGLLAETPIVP